MSPRGAVHRVLHGLLLTCLAASPATLTAQDSAPSSSPTSSVLRSAISEGLPRYDPSVAAKADNSALVASRGPVLTMQKMVVTGRQIPPNADFQSAKEKSEQEMKTYLGSKDGLDRGVLNRFNIADLWKKIPLLGLIPCPVPNVSNAARAHAMAVEDRRLADRDDLEDLVRLDDLKTPAQKKAERKEIRETMSNTNPWQ